MLKLLILVVIASLSIFLLMTAGTKNVFLNTVFLFLSGISVLCVLIRIVALIRINSEDILNVFSIFWEWLIS